MKLTDCSETSLNLAKRKVQRDTVLPPQNSHQMYPNLLRLTGRLGGVPLHERLEAENNTLLTGQVFPQAEVVGPQVYPLNFTQSN